jgi:hypothetical protein
MAPDRRGWCSSRSTHGAPVKIHTKQGTKVTQVATMLAYSAASGGANGTASRQAARKATNCSTWISGPGVVSASPSPSTISAGLSQPWASTACWAT